MDDGKKKLKEEWDLIKREYHQNEVEFDVIEEFVENLLD